MKSVHALLATTLVLVTIASALADTPATTPMPLSQATIDTLDNCEYRYYTISVPKATPAPGYLRISLTQNSTGALDAYLSPDVLPNEVYYNASAHLKQNGQETYIDTLCNYPAGTYYFVIKGSSTSTDTKFIATPTISPAVTPVTLKPDGTKVKDVSIGTNAYSFFKLSSPDNGTSVTSSMVVTVSNIRGGSVSVYVNNATEAGPACNIGSSITCDDTCNIPINACEFVGSTWGITVQNQNGATVQFDIAAKVTIPKTIDIAPGYNSQAFVKPADFTNYIVSLNKTAVGKRLIVTTSGALRGSINMTLAAGSFGDGCGGGIGLNCLASPACSLVVPACATEEGDLYLTVVGVSPNSDARISYVLTVSLEDDTMVELKDGKAVTGLVTEGVFNHFKYTVDELAIDQEMLVRLYVKGGSTHKLALFAANTTEALSVCNSTLPSVNVPFCQTDSHCEVLLDRCSLTKGDWYFAVYAETGFQYVTGVNYTIEVLTRTPTELVSGQAILGYADSDLQHYSLKIPDGVSPASTLTFAVDATDNGDIDLYVRKKSLAGCTSCYSADFSLTVKAGDSGAISIPPCLIGAGTWYVGIKQDGQASSEASYSLKAELTQPSVTSLSLAKPVTSKISIGEAASYSLSPSSDADTLTVTLVTNPSGQATTATGTLGFALFNSSYDQVSFGRQALAVDSQPPHDGTLCIDQSCTVDSKTTACVLRVPTCYLEGGSWYAVVWSIVPDNDAQLLDVEYTLTADTAPITKTQLTAGTPFTKTSERPIQDKFGVSTFDHYAFDVSNIKESDQVYVEVTLYADSVSTDLYLNPNGPADDNTCFASALGCKALANGECSVVLQPCELEGGKWQASVELAARQGAAKPVTYTLVYNVRQPEILTSGFSVTSRISDSSATDADASGKLKHYKLEVPSPANAGALLDVELTSVNSNSKGGLKVYVNKGHLAGCSNCLGYLESCTTTSQCTVTIPPCELSEGDYYIAVGFADGAIPANDDGFVLTATMRQDSEPVTSKAGTQNNNTVDAYQVLTTTFSDVPTAGAIDIVVLNPTSKKNAYTLYAAPADRPDTNNTVQCLSITCSYNPATPICTTLSVNQPQSKNWIVSVTGTNGPSDYSFTLFQTAFTTLTSATPSAKTNLAVGASALYKFTQKTVPKGTWLSVKVDSVNGGAVTIQMNKDTPVQTESGAHTFASFPGTCSDAGSPCRFYIPTCDLLQGDYYLSVTSVAGPVSFSITVTSQAAYQYTSPIPNGQVTEFGYQVYKTAISAPPAGSYLTVDLSAAANSTSIPTPTIARAGTTCSYLGVTQIAPCCFGAGDYFIALTGSSQAHFDLDLRVDPTQNIPLGKKSPDFTVDAAQYRHHTFSAYTKPGQYVLVQVDGLNGQLFLNALPGFAGNPSDSSCYNYNMTAICTPFSTCIMQVEPCLLAKNGTTNFELAARGAKGSSQSTYTVEVTVGGGAVKNIAQGTEQKGTIAPLAYQEFHFSVKQGLGPLAYLRFDSDNAAGITATINPLTLAGSSASCRVAAKTSCATGLTPIAPFNGVISSAAKQQDEPMTQAERMFGSLTAGAKPRFIPRIHGAAHPLAPNGTNNTSPSPSPNNSPSPSASPSPSPSPSTSPSPTPNPFPNSCVAISECPFAVDNALGLPEGGNMSDWYIALRNGDTNIGGPGANYDFRVAVVDPTLMNLPEGAPISQSLNEDYIAGFEYTTDSTPEQGDYLNIVLSAADAGTVITVRPLENNSSLDCDHSAACTVPSGDSKCTVQVDSCLFSGPASGNGTKWIVKVQGPQSGSVTVTASHEKPLDLPVGKAKNGNLATTGIYQMFSVSNFTAGDNNFLNFVVTLTGDNTGDSIVAYANPVLPAGAPLGGTCYNNLGTCTATSGDETKTCYIPVPPCAFVNQTGQWYVGVKAKSGTPSYKVEARLATPKVLEEGVMSDADYLGNNEFSLYTVNTSVVPSNSRSYLVVTVVMANNPCAEVTATPYLLDPLFPSLCTPYEAGRYCTTKAGSKTCQIVLDTCEFEAGDWHIAVQGSSTDNSLANYYITADVRDILIEPVAPYEQIYDVSSDVDGNGDVTEYLYALDAPFVGGTFVNILLSDFTSGTKIYIRQYAPVGVDPDLSKSCTNEIGIAMSQTCTSDPCVLTVEPCAVTGGEFYIHIKGSADVMNITQHDVGINQLTAGNTEAFDIPANFYQQHAIVLPEDTEISMLTVSVQANAKETVDVYLNRNWHASDACSVQSCTAKEQCVLIAGRGPGTTAPSNAFCTEETLEGNWFVSVKSSSAAGYAITVEYEADLRSIRQFEAHQCESIHTNWTKSYRIPFEQIQWPAGKAQNQSFVQVDFSNTNKKVVAYPSTGLVAGPCAAEKHSTSFDYYCLNDLHTYLTFEGAPDAGFDFSVTAVQAPVYTLINEQPVTTLVQSANTSTTGNVHHFMFTTGDQSFGSVLSSQVSVVVNDPSKSGAKLDIAIAEGAIAGSPGCEVYAQTGCTTCGYDQLCFTVKPNTDYYLSVTTIGGDSKASFTVMAANNEYKAAALTPDIPTSMSLDLGNKAVFTISGVQWGDRLTIAIPEVSNGAVTMYANARDSADASCNRAKCTADRDGCVLQFDPCETPQGDWYVTVVGAGSGICDVANFTIEANIAKYTPPGLPSTEIKLGTPVSDSLQDGEAIEHYIDAPKIANDTWGFLQIKDNTGTLEIRLAQTHNDSCANLTQYCTEAACIVYIYPCMLYQQAGGIPNGPIYITVRGSLAANVPESTPVTYTLTANLVSASKDMKKSSDTGTLTTLNADYAAYFILNPSSQSLSVDLQVTSGNVRYFIGPAEGCQTDPYALQGSLTKNASSTPLSILEFTAKLGSLASPYADKGLVVILNSLSAVESSDYTLKIQNGNCGGLGDASKFCSSSVGYSVWNADALAPRASRAEAEYARLVRGFGCPRSNFADSCSACSNFVAPDCAKALQEFSCWDSFRKCDGNGFITRLCATGTCAYVESACGITWEEAGFPEYACNTTIYANDKDEECTGGSSGGEKSSSTGKTVGIVLGAVAGAAVLIGVGVGISKMGGSAAAASAGGSGAAAASGGSAAAAGTSGTAAASEPLLPGGEGPDAAGSAV